MSSFLEHAGKQILLQDFSNIADIGEGLRAVAAARGFVAALAASPGAAPRLLLLTSVENSTFNPQRVEALKAGAGVAGPPIAAAPRAARLQRGAPTCSHWSRRSRSTEAGSARTDASAALRSSA